MLAIIVMAGAAQPAIAQRGGADWVVSWAASVLPSSNAMAMISV